MGYYCGLDVSLEQSSVCVVNASGLIVREAMISSEAEALIVWFSSLDVMPALLGKDSIVNSLFWRAS